MFPGGHDDRPGESSDDDGPNGRCQIRWHAFEADLRKNRGQRRGAGGHERKRQPSRGLSSGMTPKTKTPATTVTGVIGLPKGRRLLADSTATMRTNRIPWKGLFVSNRNRQRRSLDNPSAAADAWLMPPVERDQELRLRWPRASRTSSIFLQRIVGAMFIDNRVASDRSTPAASMSTM
jgi:hypothetical protein